MNIPNSLLRSAYQIAQRKGKDTNWEAFAINLRRELLKLAGIPDCKDEQMAARATCTPLTYRLPPGTDDKENNEYLIGRLERVIELINEGDNHMAVAKLLADISALKAPPEDVKQI